MPSRLDESCNCEFFQEKTSKDILWQSFKFPLQFLLTENMFLAKIRPTRIQCRNCVCYRSVFWIPSAASISEALLVGCPTQLNCSMMTQHGNFDVSWPESRTFKFRCQLNVAPLGKRKGVSKELFSFMIVTCHKKLLIILRKWGISRDIINYESSPSFNSYFWEPT